MIGHTQTADSLNLDINNYNNSYFVPLRLNTHNFANSNLINQTNVYWILVQFLVSKSILFWNHSLMMLIHISVVPSSSIISMEIALTGT